MPDQLNEEQKSAVHHIDTPLLVLAGAGSGKTRVITYKIAPLIGKKILLPEHITAVTFTNKASREMKRRVARLLSGIDSKGLHISTFHILGLKIIRREKSKLGLRSGFTIYDQQDTLSLIRELLRRDFDGSSDIEDVIRRQISAWKNSFHTAEHVIKTSLDTKEHTAAQIYLKYDQCLRIYNAVDFDELISLPALLFSRDKQTLLEWQHRIRYLLIDEYQDTNTAQYQVTFR